MHKLIFHFHHRFPFFIEINHLVINNERSSKTTTTAQSVLVYRDAEKPNDEKANFEVMIQNEYLSKATKKGSRHWKTREEVKELEIACQHRDAYKVAKNDFVNRRGKVIFNKTMLPLS